MTTLETVSGNLVDVSCPDPATISIEDIAWHLSRLSRFCGATIPNIPYSVAQHSVQVKNEVICMMMLPHEYPDIEEILCHNETVDKDRMAFHGLMHDAAEAYIGDIPSPVKHITGFKEAINEIEERLLRSVYDSVGVEYPTELEWAYIHYADMVQRAIEAHNFMFSRGKGWGLPKVSFKKLQQFESPWISAEAYDNFLYDFNDLIRKVK